MCMSELLGKYLTCSKYSLHCIYFLIYLSCSLKFLLFSLDTLSPSQGGTPVPQNYRIQSISVFIHLKHIKSGFLGFFAPCSRFIKGCVLNIWQKCDNCAGNFLPALPETEAVTNDIPISPCQEREVSQAQIISWALSQLHPSST